MGADNVPSHAEILDQIVAVLRGSKSVGYSFQLNHIYAPLKSFLQERYGRRADEYLDLVHDVLWELMLRGVVGPFNMHSVGFPFIHVTEKGRAWLENNILTAYDPSGYLIQTTRLVPELSETARGYLAESVQAKQRGLLLSATITLGVASECLMLDLVDVFGAGLRDPLGSDFRKRIERWSLSRKVQEFEGLFEERARTRVIPEELRYSYISRVRHLFDFYRQSRNDAGHPTGIKPDEDILDAQLIAFPKYAQALYAIIAWLRERPGSL